MPDLTKLLENASGAVLEPGDLLVVSARGARSLEDVDALRGLLDASPLAGRYVLIAGDVDLLVARNGIQATFAGYRSGQAKPPTGGQVRAARNFVAYAATYPCRPQPAEAHDLAAEILDRGAAIGEATHA